jgi:hypothetical protein
VTPLILNPFQLGAGLPMGLAQVQVWQGQFPPPEAIERYERVQPGAFDRILKMAERQQESDIGAARETRLLVQSDTKRGVWLGWSVTVGAIIGAVVCAYIGQPAVALVLIAVPVMSVAKALVDSSRAARAAASPPEPPKAGAPDQSDKPTSE